MSHQNYSDRDRDHGNYSPSTLRALLPQRLRPRHPRPQRRLPRHRRRRPGPHDAERPNTLRRRFPVPAWLLEIGSILLSIGALLAAIVVMAVQNGKPVVDWTFPASINTVVSTLGVISKVSLAFTISACLGQQKWNWFRQHQGNVSLFEVFDSASRGPNWAILGAIVTVLTVTFDPFLQATVNLSGQLALSRFTFNSTISDIFTLQQDFGLTAAIFDGFALGGVSNPLVAQNPLGSFACPTGNCTWPIFTTAAVCSTCRDVSSSVVRRPRTKCSSKDSTNQAMGNNAILIADCTEYHAPYGNIKQYNGLASRPDGRGPVPTTQGATSGFVVLTANNFVQMDEFWEDATIEATECGLYMCAAAINATASNGELTETRVREWSNRVPKTWGSLATDEDSRHFADVVAIPATEATSLGAGSSQLIFNFTQASILGMQRRIQELTLGLAPTNETLLVFPTNARNSAISALAPLLGVSSNFTRTFELVAQRLSVYNRDAGGATQQGTVQEFIFLVNIDWPFLLAPIIAVLAGLLYFIVIMFQTWRLGLPVWKESAYPTLTYGFDERTQSLFRGADVHESSKDLKKTTQINFTEGQDGLRLNVAAQR
ncbi:unnamed protein product [Parascedosporium putredinis]|uniref:Uncharacterized protein n=1 Tax=Parascedosporium putredinis TaxID=1442378 RepID=A0A9P1H2M0_9PEZI|nr:unnamed protein product [Parascedosporium putredinis]CAI7994180.1 unnamed protein product [Parascedosporium putredinis]